MKQAQASLAAAEIDLNNTYIKAPVDGVVVARNVDVGQTVAASLAAPTLFLIAQDLTKMQVDTNVSEADVGRVKVGQDATFTVDAYPGRVFKGSVTAVREAPINVQNVITYDVVIGVSNPDLKLFPGMTANVKIMIDQRTDVLKVPNAALRFRPATAQPARRRDARVAAGKGGAAPHAVGVGAGRGQQAAAGAREDGRNRRHVHRDRGGSLKEGDQVIVAAMSKSGAPAASGSAFSAQPSGGGRRGPGFYGAGFSLQRALTRLERSQAMSAVIEIKDLVKDYKLGDVPVHVLKGISLDIERGDFVAIMGPSGSGKSTLMNILGCLDKPTTGIYRLDGIGVGALDRDQLAEIRNRKIGFVFQQFNLLARTSAVENVELPLMYTDDSAAERRERAHEGAARGGPGGPGGASSQPAFGRTAAARGHRALAGERSEDHPGGRADRRARFADPVEIMAIFQRLNREQGITMIVVTHEPDIAAYANRNIHFKDGSAAAR